MATVSPFAVRGGEAHLLQQLLHHRLQPAGADVLDPAVDLVGELGDLGDRVVGEVQGDALGAHQRGVLLDQAGLGLDQDAGEVVAAERLQLDPDRQAALQLGQQVRGLAQVEGAAGDEQDVVGLDRHRAWS